MKNNLARIRESKGISQNQLAELSGVSRTTISFLETGKDTNSQAKTFSAIAKALDEPVSKIFYPDCTAD